jgi:hypothetical protein
LAPIENHCFLRLALQAKMLLVPSIEILGMVSFEEYSAKPANSLHINLICFLQDSRFLRLSPL